MRSRAFQVVVKQGRHRLVDWRPPARLFAGLVLLTGGVLASLTLYTPSMHRALGDTTTLAGGPLTLFVSGSRVLSDSLAGLSNVLFTQSVPADVDASIPTVRLLLGSEALKSLNHRMPLYDLGVLPDRPSVPGLSEIAPGRNIRVRVNFRGTNTWHHQWWKPSLRIRYPKTTLADGYRDHLLNAPEDPTGLRNWLSGELSRELGLLNVDEHFVRLFINNHYFGTYTRQWRLDDLLFERQREVPGALYRLESGTGPTYRRREAQFSDAATWEIQAQDPSSDAAALRQLLAAVALPPSVERQQDLHELLDGTAVARWEAILCHAQSIHSNNHNIALWLNPATGLFNPIIVDPNGYGMLPSSRGIVHHGNPLIQAWLADPRNLALYMDTLYDLLQGAGSESAIADRVRGEWRKVRPNAMADAYSGHMGVKDGVYTRALFSVRGLDRDVDDLLAHAARTQQSIRAEMSDTSLQAAAPSANNFELWVSGLQGVIARNKKTGGTFVLLTSLSQPAKSSEAAPRAYAFHSLPGRPEHYEFLTRLTRLPLHPDPWIAADKTVLRREQGLHPDQFGTARTTPVILGPGQVVVRSTRDFAAGQPVTVRAGTLLLLAPEASLHIRGEFRIEGTAEDPVRIRPLEAGRPFGVIAVWGPGVGRVHIRHLDIEGGSKGRRFAQNFSGMISIHGVENVDIRSSRIGPNRAGDDALHIVKSTAAVVDCVFEKAASDAMDWDAVSGVIQRCLFRNSGNDAIDVGMADQVRIADSRFEACGDKCISIGEGTTAAVQRCRMRGGSIGVAVKNASRALLQDLDVRDFSVGVGAYQNQWRWQKGGHVWFDRVAFTGSRQSDVGGDKDSELWAVGSLPPDWRKEGKAAFAATPTLPAWAY